jgi:hypothetical protein
MPSKSVHGKLDSEETDAAAWQATRGAVTGAARVCSFLELLRMWSFLMLQDVDGVWFLQEYLANLLISGAFILQLRLASHMFIHQYTVV